MTLSTDSGLYEHILENFKYEDGKLWRINRRFKNRVWTEVDLCKNMNTGYCAVGVNRRPVLYHRIVWMLLKGKIPEGLQLDHIDGNRLNNIISNLRVVTSRKNAQNTNLHRVGKKPGCRYREKNKRWEAYIKINRKYTHIGCFATMLEAYDAYLQAEQELLSHPSP